MNPPLIRCVSALAFTCLVTQAPAQQLSLKHFGQDEGLGNLAVTALAQDAAGYIWAGTESGLYRFNGTAFRRYGTGQGMTDADVTALFSSRAAGTWVGTYGNFYRIDGGRLTPILYEGKPIAVWPGQVNAETADHDVLVVTEGRLLAVARQGGGVRNYFTPEQIRRQPELAKIGSVHVDADGSLWMACMQALCNVGGGRAVVHGREAGLPPQTWTSIVRDTEGTLWIRSATRVFARPAGADRFEERTPAAIRMPALRTELHLDAEGRVIVNVDSGLVRWQGGTWQSFGKEQGLQAGGGVTSILQDQEHGIWLGTLGRGLVHWLGYGNWENWTTSQGLPDDVIITAQRDRQGILHVGTRSGHAWQAPGERRFRADTGPAAFAGHQWASMVGDAQDRLWAGTYTGLLLRRGRADDKTTVIARQPMIYQLLADRGRLLLATASGMRSLPENASAGMQPQAAPVPAVAGRHPENPVTAGCADRRGHLWFASVADVLHFDGQTWDVLRFGPALGGRDIMAFACARDGTLLASTNEGLWRLHTGSRPGATRIDAPVLRDRAIHSVAEDSRGWVWVGLDVGFAVWNRSRWRLLNQTHGLAWNDTNGRGSYEDHDGSMWLITSNGLSHVLHPERLFELAARKPVIEEVLRGGRALPAGGTALPWTPDQLVFHLANPQYEDRQGFRYRFRLIGVDDQWNDTVQPEVRYAALPGGDYRFQLVTVDNDTGKQSAPAELAFSIAPPWWRSRLFYGLCALATLGAFLAFHRVRLHALTRREAKLAALVQDRTRELEQSREEMRVRALKDGLTGCWNRVATMEIIEREIGKCARSGDSLALVLLDLDHFKRINDTHGHLAGDAVLVEVAHRLRSAVRPYDAVGRYGGEEFIMVLPGLTLPAEAGRIDALRAAVRAEPVDIGAGKTLAVTASFGVVSYTCGAACDIAALVGRADQALYRSKNEGRDRISYAG
jgi:diguanylate cyclase (GGDEF)-like protein